MSVWPNERGADRPARATCHPQVPGDMKSADFPQLVVSKAISTFGHVAVVQVDRSHNPQTRLKLHIRAAVYRRLQHIGAVVAVARDITKRTYGVRHINTGHPHNPW